LSAITAKSSDDAATPIDLDWAVLASDGAVVRHDGTGVTVDLRLQGTSALLLPPTPAAVKAIPAIVDPSTAAAAAATGGRVGIDIPGGGSTDLVVAAVARRFPGAPARFAITDRGLTELAFDLLDPGYGSADEVWLSMSRGDERTVTQALARPPLNDLAVARRSVIEDRLTSDPLARFTLGLFGVAALIAAALAVAAIYLSTADDAADQAPLHRALAAEGVPPRALSGMVRTASIAVAVAAILVGTIGALLLLRVVTRVIAVTATSSVPVPPLLGDFDARDLVLAVVVLVVPCATAAALAARAARRAARGDLLREFG